MILGNALFLGFGSVKLDLKSKTKKGVVRLLFQCICRINTKGSMTYQSLSTDRHFPDDEHVSGKKLLNELLFHSEIYCLNCTTSMEYEYFF